MTAVASPPTFTQHNRPTWGMNGVNGNHNGQIVTTENLNRMLMPRKSLQRNNSSSSVSSTSSTSSAASTSTIAASASQSNGAPAPSSDDMNAWSTGGTAAQRKRPQAKAPWPPTKPEPQPDYSRMPPGSRQQLINGLNGSGPLHAAPPIVPSQGQMTAQQQVARPVADSVPPGSQPVLYLLSLNGTFERKTVSVPFAPDTLRIGRQTNMKTVPTPVNGFFDSKVLSRQHAEIWADRQGKIWIRDVRSSNGTFVNGTRLSPENRESEPHELQTGDHLELGIDIVSEDQKTVVHHKVAAKVEHAGLLSATTSLLDINFGDLDPSNGPMMMMGPQGPVPLRQRTGSQSSMTSNGGRMMQGGAMMGPQMHGMGHQRGFFFSPISTEQIVKKLQQELRGARLQSQDLGRTGQFIHMLASKDDVKDMEKPEISEPAKPMVNGAGNSLSFRSDNKTRFSDPPAPPPQQPLPEKPDVPALKRAITERPKQHPQTMSPIRHEGSGSQILQLTEALNLAKKEIETQTSRMREMEEMLYRERHARELAEDLARRLEGAAAAAAATANGNGVKESHKEETVLGEAPAPSNDEHSSPDDDTMMPDADKAEPLELAPAEMPANHLHAQLESMVLEIKDLREQLEMFKHRAETAEAERDSQRKTLAELALQIRKETEASHNADEKAVHTAVGKGHTEGDGESSSSALLSRRSSASDQTGQLSDDASDRLTRLRSDTITPNSSNPNTLHLDHVLVNTLPYASMVSVVIIGMGLMVYINGWPPQRT
ncbi:hypothetical protein F5Y17DRAFT_459249 [Xylariaceae sp. FL0594]|nr:hypothetical protein F5Y17DRAFT_459249 [Xylariaceae sp. FL0594]